MCYGVPGQVLFGFPVGDNPATTRLGYSILESRKALLLSRLVATLNPDVEPPRHEVGLIAVAPGAEQRTIAELHRDVVYRAMELFDHEPDMRGDLITGFHTTSTPPFLIEPNAPMATSHPAGVPADFVLDQTHDNTTVAMMGLAGGGQGAGVRVGVLDSGLDAALSPRASLAAVAPVAALNVMEWDDPSLKNDVTDGYGHGTSMACIIHEHAPKADLSIIRVADDSGCTTTFHLIAGLAVAANCQVINVSIASAPQATKFSCSHLSGELVSSNLAAIVRDTSVRDAVIVAAAGNRSLTHLAYPARIAESFAVVSVNSNKDLSGFSNHGTVDHDSQPHGAVFAVPGGDGQLPNGPITEAVGADTTGTKEYAGTSYATAYATAAIAQYRGTHPHKARSQVVTDLAAKADKTFTGYDQAKHGQGILTVP